MVLTLVHANSSMVIIDEEDSFQATTNNDAESSKIGRPLDPSERGGTAAAYDQIGGDFGYVGLPLDRVDGDDGFHICFWRKRSNRILSRPRSVAPGTARNDL